MYPINTLMCTYGISDRIYYTKYVVKRIEKNAPSNALLMCNFVDGADAYMNWPAIQNRYVTAVTFRVHGDLIYGRIWIVVKLPGKPGGQEKRKTGDSSWKKSMI